MNKRRDFIDKIADNRQMSACIDLLNTLYEYYKLCDMESGTNHAEIFHSLYMGEKASLQSIARKYYIGDCTLHRYRKRYNKLAEELAESELKEMLQHIEK